MKKDYINNILDILDDGVIENYELKKVDVLRDIFKDSELGSIIYNKFEHNFSTTHEYDELFMKCGDMIYRMDKLVNEYICPKIPTIDHYRIKEILLKMIDEIDLYSAVNYSEDEDTLDELFELDESLDLDSIEVGL